MSKIKPDHRLITIDLLQNRISIIDQRSTINGLRAGRQVNDQRSSVNVAHRVSKANEFCIESELRAGVMAESALIITFLTYGMRFTDI